MSYYQIIDEQKRSDGISGAFIGRYQVRKELGRGAMGVVYLAQDPAIGRSVAVKTINFNAVSDSAEEKMLMERLIKEARSAGGLQHPNIVTIYDIGQTNSSAYIVMEFVEGETLLDRMNQGGLDPQETFQILEKAAAGLDYAHEKGVLHRDVKPANIMIDSSGKLKIMDFGVARITSQHTIKQSMVLGTPSYMAPEQISNKPLSGAGDQFSLAVIAYEMLAGQRPFAADSISALLFNIVYVDPRTLRECNPELPDTVEPVIRRALSKNAADRFPTCSDFVAALRGAFQTTTMILPALPAAETSTQALQAASIATSSRGMERMAEMHEKKGNPLAWVLASVLAIALAVIGGLVWKGMKSEAPRAATTEPVVDTPSVTPKKTSGSKAVAKAVPPVVVVKTQDPAPAPSARTSEPTATVAAGNLLKLELYTAPSGAQVKVGSQGCTSPCFVEVKRGEYKVSAELAGHKTENRIVTMTESRELHITLTPPMGTLIVSEPAGATVLVAGKTFTTPLSVKLPAGPHAVEIRHDGRVYKHTVNIEDDVPMILTAGTRSAQ